MSIRYIPGPVVDDILKKANIVDVVERRLALRRAGSEYASLCPFHDERSPSFTVSPEKQFYHCFGCGSHGTAIGFIMEYEGLPFVEAAIMLADEIDYDLDAVINKGSSANEALFKLTRNVAFYYQENLFKHQVASDYLVERGITPDIIERFGLGYAEDGWNSLEFRFKDEANTLRDLGYIKKNEDMGSRYDKFRHRIMFPVRSSSGDVVGFTGRVIDNSQKPKYMNSEDSIIYKKSELLYGLYENKQAIRKQNRVLVVEGHMDVVSLVQHSVEEVVASQGTALTAAQLGQLLQYTRRIYFCMDGDKAGRAAAEKALLKILPELRDGVEVYFVFFPEGQDPDSFIKEQGKDAFEEKLSQAIPLTAFFFDVMVYGKASVKDKETFIKDNSIESRISLAAEAVTHLASITKAALLKSVMMETTAKICGVNNRDLLLANAKDFLDEPEEPVKKPNVKTLNIFTDIGALAARALGVLLNFPVSARHLQPININYIDDLEERHGKVATLLKEVIAICQKDNIESSAILIERFREHPEEAALSDLLAKAQNERDMAQKEFVNMINNLNDEGKKEKINALSKKSFDEFTDEDKALFSAMLMSA